MATDSSVLGLFMDPSQYLQQQSAGVDQRAAQFAQMTPMQQAQFGIYGGANRLAGGLAGLMGVEDPQMKLQSLRAQVLKGVDQTDAKSLAEAAKALADAGDLQGASAIAQQSVGIQAKIDEKQAGREQQMQMFRERLAQQKDLADQANQTKLMIAQMTKALSGANNDLQRQILEEKLGALKQKQSDIEEARTTKLKNTVDTADNVIQVAEEAKKLTSGWTTGLTGTLAGLKPGSDAYNLQAKIDTIKSQLGFSQLQSMRDASPTGGALGQVSNQEIKYLQAALANLDKAQTSKDLKDNLDKVITHYGKWRDAAVGKLEEKGIQTPEASTAKKSVIKLD
jgi:hypothetical protein